MVVTVVTYDGVVRLVTNGHCDPRGRHCPNVVGEFLHLLHQLHSRVGLYGPQLTVWFRLRQRIGIESIHYRGRDNSLTLMSPAEIGRHIVVPNRQIVVQEGSHLEDFS